MLVLICNTQTLSHLMHVIWGEHYHRKMAPMLGTLITAWTFCQKCNTLFGTILVKTIYPFCMYQLSMLAVFEFNTVGYSIKK